MMTVTLSKLTHESSVLRMGRKAGGPLYYMCLCMVQAKEHSTLIEKSRGLSPVMAVLRSVLSPSLSQIATTVALA